MKRKVVVYQQFFNVWTVWDRALKCERGQFACRRQAELCASQGELDL